MTSLETKSKGWWQVWLDDGENEAHGAEPR